MWEPRGVTDVFVRQHEIREARECGNSRDVSRGDKTQNTEVWKLENVGTLGVSQRDKTEHESREVRECGNSRGVSRGIRQNTGSLEARECGNSRGVTEG
ncbi:hypothetical protein RRG08_045632 [Elysia crispata]|uniref:Uncharacterized protein n=1 Tax=Elysia crispata TaxID=231223 RepID=A0AAE0XYZ0_9GAST|nr:hypothetical protein RRG08_045632 [Elysia crispata]